MKQQITTAIDTQDMERLDKIKGSRTRYEFAQTAVLEKIEREEKAKS